MNIHQGDARDMHMIEDGSVRMFVSSSPYPRQRSYGEDPREIGKGKSFRHFVDELVEVGKDTRRCLTADGSWWCNLGWKSTASGGAGGDYNAGGSRAGQPKFGAFKDPDLDPGQIMEVGNLVVAGLQRDGWRLRATIIWDKGPTGCERQDPNHVRRPVMNHETIMVLAPSSAKTRTFYRSDETVERGSVWHFPPGNSDPATKHLAPFPDELPRRCILLGSEPGDLVGDQFAGSGTTLRVAEQLGRRSVGVDLYAAQNDGLI